MNNSPQFSFAEIDSSSMILALLDASKCGVVVMDAVGQVICANSAMAALMGLPEDGQVDSAALHEAASWIMHVTDGETSGTMVPIDGRGPSRVSAHSVEVGPYRAVYVEDEGEGPDQLDGQGKQLLGWYQALISRSTDLLCVIDRAGSLQWASRSFLGYERGTQVGTSFAEFIHPDDVQHAYERFSGLFDRLGKTESVQLRLASSGGGWHHVDIVAVNYLDDPKVNGIVATIRDVTERAEAVARLEWQAFHDGLTRLPNRTLLLDRLDHALQRDRRTGRRTAAMFIDLDFFKDVNDTHGHLVGDQVLQAVADRLRKSVRSADTVSRMGGDEFVVVCEEVRDPIEVTYASQRISEAVSLPIDIDGLIVCITPSIGIAYDRGMSAEQLLRDADQALYTSKMSGRDRVSQFSALKP